MDYLGHQCDGQVHFYTQYMIHISTFLECRSLTDPDASVLREKHVAGLQVAMDDGRLVEEDEGLANLTADRADLRLRERLLQLLHDAVDRPARAELYVHLRRGTHIVSGFSSSCMMLSTAHTELYVHLR